MNVALWVIQVLLAVAFLMAGGTKVTRRKEELAARMGWVEDVGAGTVRLIGGLELLGALGLILPAATGVLSWLTPLAGIGLALTMLGAMITHLRRGEASHIAPPAVLFILAAIVAYGRFAVAPL